MGSRGVYKVGERIFENKLEALLHANSTRQQVIWDFFNSRFATVNWTRPLNVPLKELYRLRAQQLREKYDYLVLHYSAGSDSTNVLRSFIDNGIKLDEVFVRWPIRLAEATPYSNSSDPTNYLNEWNITIKPALTKLRSEHPELKISVKDTSDGFREQLSSVSDKDIHVKTGGQHFSPMSFNSISISSDSEIAALDSNIKIASIFGIGKPILREDNGRIYTYFSDYAINSAGHRQNLEPFYWTPDFPEIVVEQVHLILNVIRANPFLESIINNRENSLSNSLNPIVAEQAMKKILYPDWDLNTFQLKKTFGFDNAYNDFLFNSTELDQGLDRYKWHLKDLLSGLSRDNIFWIDGKPNGIRGMNSPAYFVGCL